ncbi:hypothetical protein ACOJEA_004766 [Klebsiella aerogenes]
MKSLADIVIPSGGFVPITTGGSVIIQAKTGTVQVANEGAVVGSGFTLPMFAYETFSVGSDGLQVSNSTSFPVTIAVVQL